MFKLIEMVRAERERERLEAVKLMEEARDMDKTAQEYLTAKKIVERYQAFRPEATVNEFYDHFFNLKEAETMNPFLPVIVMADINDKRMAR